MYLNKHARMSTVDRAVELAVRNNVRVPGLAAWDEIARALEHGAARVGAKTTRCSRSPPIARRAATTRAHRRATRTPRSMTPTTTRSRSPTEAEKIPFDEAVVPAQDPPRDDSATGTRAAG